MNDFEKKHINNALRNASLIGRLYDDLVKKMARLLSQYKPTGAKSVWDGNKALERKLDQLLQSFGVTLTGHLKEMIEKDWELAEQKNDELVKNLLKGSTVTVAGVVVYDLFNRKRPGKSVRVILKSIKNLFKRKKSDVKLSDVMAAPRRREALLQFLNRKEGGMGLSERVWKLTKLNKSMIEELLHNNIIQGGSAAQNATHLKKYLNNPDMYFRRVRNKKTGKLELSARAKEFHPGRGVYRSSYQNALRLAQTETNMGYRMADHNRWKNNPTVVGFEVKTSHNHPTEDMCDDLKGEYPKDFIFTGWHPKCICYAVPVMLSDKEFESHEDAILTGQEPKINSKNRVRSVPAGFNRWIKSKAKASKGWKNQPYFIRDNFKGGKIEGGLRL
ncbi:hypothetical protein [Prolixibacter denitrificans]|uniref:Phage Mu protein F like protein n=1 Tax=Prolixibacter denitrificans TaxID=1541063 RepID=A0A2P8CJW2_9BACT|nr:hypothetical protein [Prolixibacter denitrificans]PSK85259.1 hypothetical protein CLV93_101211 [Prolixibacter denitrificans]GET19881.1 hypothetical protein JCM18694_01270 [Prolixibacter denitrificans]